MNNDSLNKAQKALEAVKQKVAQGQFLSSYRVEDPNDISAVFQHFLMLGQSPVERWQIEQAKVVPVRSLKEVVLSAADRRRAIRNSYPQDCYRNAIKVSKKLGAMYCEGWVNHSGMPLIRHAWNCVNESHFDVTAEQFLNWKPDLTIYVMALAISAEEAQALWKQRNCFDFSGGEVLSSIYWRKHYCPA
jgi:hypothetical protein